MIPKSVTLEEFKAASAPLFDLLGTSGNNAYLTPGTFIFGDTGDHEDGMVVARIVLSHVPGGPGDFATGERAKGHRVDVTPQGLGPSELVQPVTVFVVVPPPAPEQPADVISVLEDDDGRGESRD